MKALLFPDAHQANVPANGEHGGRGRGRGNGHGRGTASRGTFTQQTGSGRPSETGAEGWGATAPPADAGDWGAPSSVDWSIPSAQSASK